MVELSSSANTTVTENKSMVIVLAVTLLTIATLLLLLTALVCFIVKAQVRGKRSERDTMAGLPDGRSQQLSLSSLSPEQSVNKNGNKYTTIPNAERSLLYTLGMGLIWNMSSCHGWTCRHLALLFPPVGLTIFRQEKLM